MSMFLWVLINLQILVKLESKPLIFWCNMFIALCHKIRSSCFLLFGPGKVSISLESKSRSIKYEGFRLCHDDFLFSSSANTEDNKIILYFIILYITRINSIANITFKRITRTKCLFIYVKSQENNNDHIKIQHNCLHHHLIQNENISHRKHIKHILVFFYHTCVVWKKAAKLLKWDSATDVFQRTSEVFIMVIFECISENFSRLRLSDNSEKWHCITDLSEKNKYSTIKRTAEYGNIN